MERERVLMALRLAEITVSGTTLSPDSKSRLRALFDMLFGGPFLLMAGLEILVTSALWTGLVAGTFYAVFLIMYTVGYLHAPSWGTLLGAAAVVYFAPPSRKTFVGVTPQRVERVRRTLLDMVSNLDELKRLQRGIEMARGHVMERITRTAFVLNLAWGVWFWFFTSHIFAAAIPQKQVVASTAAAALLFSFFIGALLAAAAYVAVVRTVHQVLAFALLDVEAQLASSVVHGGGYVPRAGSRRTRGRHPWRSG